MSTTSLGNTTIAIQNLLDRVVKGDEQAKRDLIERAYERLIIVARKLLGSFSSVRLDEETAGVLSDAYGRLQSALETVKPATVPQFMGLAAKKIREVLLDKVRGEKGRGAKPRPDRVSINAGGDSNASPGLQVADSDFDDSRRTMVIDLLEAIDKLPEEEREAVELLFFHGYSQPEAGEILGVHEDTVKRRWAKARIKLADKLSAFN